MSNVFASPRTLLIFGVALPLAAVVGYLLATPDHPTSMAVVGLVLAVLCVPIFLRWHHPLLVFTWNASINAFFLPGRPSVWMLFGGISFGIVVLSCILNKEQKFLHVPSVTWLLLALLLLIAVTAKLTGGIGVRALGSSQFGGKGYFLVLGAAIGYFGLSSQRTRPDRAQRYVSIFFLATVTYAVSNLAYVVGPDFWFLFYIFPVDFSVAQIVSDYELDSMFRLTGLGFSCMGVLFFLMMRYGIRGLLDLHKPWRLIVALVLLGLSLLGGFRSTVVVLALVFVAQFCVEGLYRTRILGVLLLAMLLGGLLLFSFTEKLPHAMQRTLTVVPFLKVDPVVERDAEGTAAWRLEMWQVLLPEVRHYFWLGKGYNINPMDLYLAQESTRRGLARNYENAIVAGDYHNGPLSTIIPFGIFGLLLFTALLIAGSRVLYYNFKYGDPGVANINRFLFAFFCARAVFFFTIFGAFQTDIAMFLGTIGLSISINGGMRRPAAAPAVETAAPEVLPPQLSYQA